MGRSEQDLLIDYALEHFPCKSAVITCRAAARIFKKIALSPPREGLIMHLYICSRADCSKTSRKGNPEFYRSMQIKGILKHILVPAVALALGATAQAASGNSCTTQAQMTAQQRSDLVNAAKMLVGDVQSGSIQALRDNTLASVSANFSGIANSATTLEPKIKAAWITVDALYTFESGSAGSGGAQFFCTPTGSTTTIVLNFSSLPEGKYALAIAHATGVPEPQQISLILANEAGQWQLAGFFSKPLLLNQHDGIWYWRQARQYARQKMDWSAWFYYQIAEYLVEPANFISSPNLEKLLHEADQAKPQNLPGPLPQMIQANGQSFEVMRVDTSNRLGPLDFVVYYTPDDTQAAALNDPAKARQQVVELMSAILQQHPGLRQAFHGVWVFASTGNIVHFSLELPMDQIPSSLAG